MEFFNSLRLGYQIMLIGIIVFVLGFIIMIIENLIGRRSSKEIKEEYLIKNNVRTPDNPAINNNSSVGVSGQSNNNPVPNSSNENSELMNLYK